MKSILYIGAGAPWLGGAGYLVRQRMLLRALAEVGELHLALFDLPEAASGDRPDYARSVTALPPVQRSPAGGLSLLAADLLCPAPRMIRAGRSAKAKRIVAALDPSRFDAVFAFRIDFAAFAGVLNHPRLLLDIDDPEHLRWSRQLAATTQGGDLRTRLDLRKLARFEKKAVSGTIASFVCNEHDRKAFGPLPYVIPNCVDVPPTCPPRRDAATRIVLMGNFNPTSPNTDAAIWFLDEIWPLIRSAVPNAEFDVVGRAHDQLKALIEKSPGARAAGFAADLPATLARSSLSVAPIRFGTGTRVKIIESFALGCPVVSTTLGAEGIEARNGHEILLGDTPADFAKHCITLLTDRALGARLAQAGYELAKTRYDEAGRRRELVAVLKDLLRRCVASAPSPPHILV